jgi:cytochrome c peroxidase
MRQSTARLTLTLGFTILLFGTYSCVKSDPSRRPEGISDLLVTLPTSVEDPPDNPSTPEKIRLGQRLFFERRLSRSGLTSCNTCHDLSNAGVDHLTRAIGEMVGQRNTPTIFNAALLSSHFADGGSFSLEEIAKGLIVAHEHLDLTGTEAVDILRHAGYQEAFKAAFPDETDPLTFNNVGKALASFVRTLLTPNAPFDRYLNGHDDALSATQKRGLRLFQDNGCVACHSGALLGGTLFTKFSHLQEKGMSHDYGAFQVSGEPDDQFVFRVSPLRNVAVTSPYFHNGSITDLNEAVRIMGKAQLGFTLSEQDISDMVDFLNSLTGEFPVIETPLESD